MRNESEIGVIFPPREAQLHPLLMACTDEAEIELVDGDPKEA